MKLLHLFIIFCVILVSACGTNNHASDGTRVKVVDGQGRGIAGATVVVGDQGGVMKSFSLTGILGETYFDSLPPDATVTAASSCYSSLANRTYYHADIAYGVNGPAVTLEGVTCDQDSEITNNINITNQVSGITGNEVTVGPITYSGSTVSMDVGSGLQDDGNISVVALGYDDAGNIRGYGLALDRPAVDGGVIDVVVDRTDLARHTHRFANIPSGTLSYFAFATLLRKNAMTNLTVNFAFGLAPLPDELTTYSPGSFADNNMFGATLSLDLDTDGNADGEIGFIRYLRTASAQLFDFSSAPVVPGSLTYDPGIAGRPVISWSGGDPLATVHQLLFDYRSNTPQRTSFSYSMTAPASATSLVFPELPDPLADFRPGIYNNLSLTTMKFDRPSSYNAYLKAVADHNGDFYEAEGLNSYSYARTSLQQ